MGFFHPVAISFSSKISSLGEVLSSQTEEPQKQCSAIPIVARVEYMFFSHIDTKTKLTRPHNQTCNWYYGLTSSSASACVAACRLAVPLHWQQQYPIKATTNILASPIGTYR